MADSARRAHGAATVEETRAPSRSISERLSWFVIAVTMLSVPLVISLEAKDSFRLPKELLFKAAGILLCALAISDLILGGRRALDRWRSRPLLAVLAAALFWCLVTTWLSTNRALSVASLFNLVVAMMVFVAIYTGASGRSLSILYLAFIPAVLNATLAITQRTTLWTPIKFDAVYSSRFGTTALLGNPDDVGMYLLTPALAASALALVSKKHRLTAMALATIIVAGMVASETLGALIALGAGLLVLFLPRAPRTTIAAMTVALLLATVFIASSPPRRAATRWKIESVLGGDFDPLLSGRIPAFLAAWRMFSTHPITGVGLGCFPFQYFDEKLAIEKTHPRLINRNVVNFGETHNEHLQILAEGGLPAYAIFLAAFIVVSRLSLRKAHPDTETAGFARALALPLAVGLFTLMLSSFPLHIAAATAEIAFFCAVILKWDEDAVA